MYMDMPGSGCRWQMQVRTRIGRRVEKTEKRKQGGKEKCMMVHVFA